MSRRPAVLLLVVLLATLGAGPVGAAPGSLADRFLSPPVYDWPVPGPPVVGFRAPSHDYGAGHRGVDLAVEAGQAVHPMAEGVVTWSGVVAGAPWTTVTHRDGIVTSYGPLQRASTRPMGTAVDHDDVIGRARGDAHEDTGWLHVGARREGRYVDPALLVAASPTVATLVGPGEVTAAVTGSVTARPTLVPGTPPSPNHLVVLAGLTSHTGGQPFPLSDLGYGDGTWEQYSYLGVDADGQPIAYDHEATWGRVHDMAEALRDQLRAHAAAHPGQAVDLLGHSLGGLVGIYYLLVLHDPADPTLPPIGRVVTVSSPLGGTDSANAVALARGSALGRFLLELVERHVATPPGAAGPVMHDEMPVLDDLETDSDVVAAVAEAWRRAVEDPWAGPLATGTDILTIGSTFDPVVNAHRSGLPGGEHRTDTDPDVLGAHTGVTADPDVEALVHAHLSGQPLPDGSSWLGQAAAGLGSGLVAAVEYAIAAGAVALGAQLPSLP